VVPESDPVKEAAQRQSVPLSEPAALVELPSQATQLSVRAVAPLKVLTGHVVQSADDSVLSLYFPMAQAAAP
jgi:hypothetical protein